MADDETVTVLRSDIQEIVDAHDEDARMGRLLGGEDWPVIERLRSALS